MDLVFTSQAEQELDRLTREQLAGIKDRLEELQENPTGHEDTKLIRLNDRQLYRLKVKENRGSHLDHRVIYDIVDNTIRIYSIFHRDHGYTSDR